MKEVPLCSFSKRHPLITKKYRKPCSTPTEYIWSSVIFWHFYVFKFLHNFGFFLYCTAVFQVITLLCYVKEFVSFYNIAESTWGSLCMTKYWTQTCIKQINNVLHLQYSKNVLIIVWVCVAIRQFVVYIKGWDMCWWLMLPFSTVCGGLRCLDNSAIDYAVYDSDICSMSWTWNVDV